LCVSLLYVILFIFFFFAPYHNKRSDVEGVTEKQHPLLCVVVVVSFCYFFSLSLSLWGPFIWFYVPRPAGASVLPDNRSSFRAPVVLAAVICLI
jgi:hypothetical protein